MKQKPTQKETEALLNIYKAANEVIARLGADGSIHIYAIEIDNLMHALYEYDQGCPKK